MSNGLYVSSEPTPGTDLGLFSPTPVALFRITIVESFLAFDTRTHWR